MKITIAELKRRLPEGTEFIVEFIGLNAGICQPEMKRTRRRVEKNKTELVSKFIDGPRVGELIYLNWKNVAADERDGSIFLSYTETIPSQEFLKITIA